MGNQRFFQQGLPHRNDAQSDNRLDEAKKADIAGSTNGSSIARYSRKKPAIVEDPSSLYAGVSPGLTDTRKRMRIKTKLLSRSHDGRLDRVI
jgi:hypothetical protein